MPYVLITPPAEEPLTVAEAQDHLRLEAGADDAYVGRLISAARRHVEVVTGQSLITKTWELVLDRFPIMLPFGSWFWPASGRDAIGTAWVGDRNGVIRLEQGQIQSVTSVKYLDTSGVEQTLSGAAYAADIESVPARLAPVDTWPETSAEPNSVRIRFDAGFGGASDVPEDIKAAMLLIIGHLYNHRESEVIGAAVTPHVFGVDALLSGYRVDWGA